MKALALLELIKMMGVSGNIEKTIDESILELRALENRSCENCKNFEEENDKCHRGVMLNWRHEIDDIDFYCNKWELR